MAIFTDELSSVDRHRVASRLVEDARERVNLAASVPASGLEDAELERLLTGLTGLEAQTAALRMDLLGESERRQIAKREGLADTAAWAARLTGPRVR